MTDTVLKKLGVKQGMRMILVDAPTSVVETLGLSTEVLAPKLLGLFDYIHLFAMFQEDLNIAFPKLKRHLRETGMLWISWPKGGELGSDLSLQEIIRVGYDHGLVESKTISVDAIWSAIKFTFPREGKQYNNTYGRITRQNQHTSKGIALKNLKDIRELVTTRKQQRDDLCSRAFPQLPHFISYKTEMQGAAGAG